MATIVAAALLLDATRTAAGAAAPAADPYAEISLPAPPRHSYVWGYGCLVTGASLIAGSFEFADQANRTYDRYLAATEPLEIARLYDRTVRNDRLSSGALLGGEALVALGLYLRFLRRPAESPVTLQPGWQRCALALHF